MPYELKQQLNCSSLRDLLSFFVSIKIFIIVVFCGIVVLTLSNVIQIFTQHQKPRSFVNSIQRLKDFIMSGILNQYLVRRMLNEIIFNLQQFQFCVFIGFREVCGFSLHSSKWLFHKQGCVTTCQFKSVTSIFLQRQRHAQRSKALQTVFDSR